MVCHQIRLASSLRNVHLRLIWVTSSLGGPSAIAGLYGNAECCALQERATSSPKVAVPFVLAFYLSCDSRNRAER